MTRATAYFCKDRCFQGTLVVSPNHLQRAPWRSCSETEPSATCLFRRTATHKTQLTLKQKHNARHLLLVWAIQSLQHF